MEYLSKVTIFLIMITCAGAGQFYSHLKNGKKVTVQHLLPHNERTERSPKRPEAIFKDQMNFIVSLDTGERIHLRLKLNKNQIGKVPMKVVSKSGTEFFDNTKPKDYRFYQVIGDSHRASVMVRCEHFRPPCYIAGSFYYKTVEYVIDPDTEIGHRVPDIPHTVYEVNPGDKKHAYDHDTVEVVTDGESHTERLGPGHILSDLLKGFRGRITKRETVKKTYKIELHIVVDDSIYNFWLERMAFVRVAALEKIEQYMEQVINNMDLRYSTATTSTMEIDVVPLIITVLEDKSNVTWITDNFLDDVTEEYHAEAALTDLYFWALDNKDPRADALICFSRRDMWSGGVEEGRYTVGVARFPIDQHNNARSGLCTGNAVSLNEDLRHDTSGTASHELGHNMGVYHDSQYNDTACRQDDLYIMASSLGFVQTVAKAKNPWTFSSCSVREMERLMSFVLKDSEGKTCLERHSYNVAEYNTIRTSDLLGEIYSTDQQCEMLVGLGSEHRKDTGINEDEICWKGIPCKTGPLSWTYRIPFSGSKCGDTKKCYQGLCVDMIPEVVTEPVPTTSSVSSSATSSTSSSTSSTTSTTSSTTTTTLSTTSSTTTSTPSTTSSTTTTTPSTTSSTTTSTPSTTSSTTTSTPSTTSSTTTSTPSTTSSTTTTTPSTTSSTTTTTPSTTSSTTTTTPSTTSSTTTTTPSTTSSTTTTTPSTTSSTTTTTPTTSSTTTTTPSTTSSTTTTTPSTTSSTTTSTPSTTSTLTTTSSSTTSTSAETTTTEVEFTYADYYRIVRIYNYCWGRCRCIARNCRRNNLTLFCRQLITGCPALSN